jgi:hypothetical protein
MSVSERKKHCQVFPKANEEIPGISNKRTYIYRCLIIRSSNIHNQMSGINFWMGWENLRLAYIKKLHYIPGLSAQKGLINPSDSSVSVRIRIQSFAESGSRPRFFMTKI